MNYITLNNNHVIPQLGFGTGGLTGKLCYSCVRYALDIGYRMIDSGPYYNNEEIIGQAIKDSNINRSEFILSSKASNHSIEDIKISLYKTLTDLQTDYIDIYLIHWPSFDSNIKIWKELISMKNNGLIKSIGVSNFLYIHISELINITNVIPVINQIELHPYFKQILVKDHLVENNIHLQAYSPLGSSLRITNDETIKYISNKYNKTPAQIILRWHIQNGHSIIPKSKRKNRINDNINIFDFELEIPDMNIINDINIIKTNNFLS